MVDFTHDNPRARFVKAQAGLADRMKLNGYIVRRRRTVCHWNHGYDDLSAIAARKDDHTGAILHAFFLAAAIFGTPKI